MGTMSGPDNRRAQIQFSEFLDENGDFADANMREELVRLRARFILLKDQNEQLRNSLSVTCKALTSREAELRVLREVHGQTREAREALGAFTAWMENSRQPWWRRMFGLKTGGKAPTNDHGNDAPVDLGLLRRQGRR